MKSNTIFLSIIIIVCGLLVAGSIFLAKNEFFETPEVKEEETIFNKVEISPVSSRDHILGNPQAEIFLVEYFDYECVYCKEFHNTMKRIMDDFSESGKFAWVLRHFPMKNHNKSEKASIYSECVFLHVGERGFWEFTNKVFEGTPESLEEKSLKDLAVSLGADESKIDECIKNNPRKEKIETDYNEGIKIHSFDPHFGTPYNILITKAGEQISMPGSLIYLNLKMTLKALIEN